MFKEWFESVKDERYYKGFSHGFDFAIQMMSRKYSELLDSETKKVVERENSRFEKAFEDFRKKHEKK